MKRMIMMLGVWLCAWTGQAKADPLGTIFYDNGSVGYGGGYPINNGYSVSNSFSVSNTTNLTLAKIGLWAAPGDTPARLQWSIGTTQFDSDIGSGTSSLSNTYLLSYGLGYDIYESIFSLSEMLNAGTYWLTLQNATSTDGKVLYWDQNSGPSKAYWSYTPEQIPSESFQLYTNSSTVDPVPGPSPLDDPPAAAVVPEPSTLALFGVLIGAGLVFSVWQRRRVAAA